MQPILNFSKQWPRAMVTLALGAFVLTVFNIFFPTGLTPALATNYFLGENQANELFGPIIFVGLTSYLFGTCSLLLGGFFIRIPISGKQMSQLDELRLEMVLFETENAMIIERYRNLRFQAEAIAGFLAAFFLATIPLFFRNVFFGTEQSTTSSGATNYSSFGLGIGVVLALCLGLFLVQRSLAAFWELVELPDE